MAFNHRHYVPILKGKRAEFASITRLRDFNSVTPLFEAIPSQAASTVPVQLSKYGWPAGRAYFVDLVFFDHDSTHAPDQPLEFVLNCMAQATAMKQKAILVTGIERSPAYQRAVAQVVNQESGVAVRLIPNDFEDGDQLGKALSALLGLFKLTRSNVDLIIDLGSVAEQNAAIISQIHRANLKFVPAITEWRTLTVAAGAFPVGLAPLVRNTWNHVARIEWQAWLALLSGARKPDRVPSYGDYTVSHTGLPPEGQATILAQLRYSTSKDFMIWKGHNAIRHKSGFNQFLGICKNLVARPEYRGANFSSGDREIQQKAANGGSPGNAETWRRIGTSHHIETVLDQIANLP